METISSLEEHIKEGKGKGGSGKEERGIGFMHVYFLSLSYFYTTLYNI